MDQESPQSALQVCYAKTEVFLPASEFNAGVSFLHGSGHVDMSTFWRMLAKEPEI